MVEKSKKRIAFITIVSIFLGLTLLFIYMNSLKEPSSSAEQSGGFYALFGDILSVFGKNFKNSVLNIITPHKFRKLAHIVEYTLVAIEFNLLYLAIFGKKPLNALYSLGAGVFIAVSDELLQLTVGRNGNFQDVLLDLIPVAIISLLFLLSFIKTK